MVNPRRLNRIGSPSRLISSAFISALVLLYVFTVWRNDAAWREGQQGPQFRTEAQHNEHGGIEDAWQQKQDLLDQLQKDTAATSSKIAAELGYTPQTKAIEHGTTATSTSNMWTTSTTSTAVATASTSSHSQHDKLRQDAHKIADADAFWPHFDAVMRAPRVTFQEAKDNCKFEDINKVNFQFANGEGGFMLNTSWTLRPRPQEDHDEQRLKWHKHVKTELLPWKEHSHKFEGRGIVVVGGSGRSVKRMKVMFRQLAKLNSKLPIEIHYWGKEMDEDKKKQLTDLWPLLYFNDLSSSSNVYPTLYDDTPGRGIHYNLKTAALINTRFAEPLLLDSDNVPVIAPESLWESDEYKEYGSIFWPDIARTRPDNPIWSITNTLCQADEFEQESGQLLVNKKKFFYHLQLAAWINAPRRNEQGAYEESFYYNFLLGDKDSFRFAWHALKTTYGRPKNAITSVGTYNQEPDGKMFYCGHSFLQYHPDGRPQFMHGGLLKTMQKPIMQWQREKNGGVFQAYKKFEHDTDHSKTFRVYIGGDERKYFPNRDDYKMGPTFCTQYPEIEAKPLADLVPGFGKMFDESGGYWLLDEPEKT